MSRLYLTSRNSRRSSAIRHDPRKNFQILNPRRPPKFSRLRVCSFLFNISGLPDIFSDPSRSPNFQISNPRRPPKFLRLRAIQRQVCKRVLVCAVPFDFFLRDDRDEERRRASGIAGITGELRLSPIAKNPRSFPLEQRAAEPAQDDRNIIFINSGAQRAPLCFLAWLSWPCSFHGRIRFVIPLHTGRF